MTVKRTNRISLLGKANIIFLTMPDKNIPSILHDAISLVPNNPKVLLHLC